MAEHATAASTNVLESVKTNDEALAAPHLAAGAAHTTPNPNASTGMGTGADTAQNEAAATLVDAIDDFLGDIEKKFRGISDEILGKLDDMAERCDRLEQEMLLRDGVRESESEQRV